jgi:hypothetical protein
LNGFNGVDALIVALRDFGLKSKKELGIRSKKANIGVKRNGTPTEDDPQVQWMHNLSYHLKYCWPVASAVLRHLQRNMSSMRDALSMPLNVG